MSGLYNLNKRLQYQGGNAEGRLAKDKLRGLKRALIYSYQSATIILQDGREFRCLINPNKLVQDYDNKILSIPYKDIRLNKPFKIGKTSEGEEEIGMKPGDVFEWKGTDSHWLVYLQYYEEDAYFRAQIRRCKDQIEVNGNKYWIYLRGPEETDIIWNLKHNVSWDDLNYTLEIYVTKNEETLEFFHRFTKFKLDNKVWEVQTVDPYSGDGIIQIYAKEYYNNTLEEEELKRQEELVPEPSEPVMPYISGPTAVKPYDRVMYTFEQEGDIQGKWRVDNTKKVSLLYNDSKQATVEITTGKSGNFNLFYEYEDKEIKLPIKILSL